MLETNLTYESRISLDPSSEFQGTVDTTYTCKWFAPLNEVHIEEPDYHAFDVWDKALQQGRQIVGGGGGWICRRNTTLVFDFASTTVQIFGLSWGSIMLSANVLPVSMSLTEIA